MVGNGWQRFATATMCVSLVGFAACSGRNGNGSPSDSATAATSSGEVGSAGQRGGHDAGRGRGNTEHNACGDGERDRHDVDHRR